MGFTISINGLDHMKYFTWPILRNLPGVSGRDAVVREPPVVGALEDVVAAVARAEHRVHAAVAAQLRILNVCR